MRFYFVGRHSRLYIGILRRSWKWRTSILNTSKIYISLSSSTTETCCLRNSSDAMTSRRRMLIWANKRLVLLYWIQSGEVRLNWVPGGEGFFKLLWRASRFHQAGVSSWYKSLQKLFCANYHVAISTIILWSPWKTINTYEKLFLIPSDNS